MTDHQPRAAGKLSHEAEEFLEQCLLWKVNDQSLIALNEDEVFWLLMNLAEPATAKRLVAHCLQLCADRGEKLPVRLAEAAISYLVKPAARNRIHNREQMIKAAAFEARHPLASLRDIGTAAGVDHTLIRQWKRAITYKMELTKQLLPCAREAYASYVKRFGSPFAAADLPEPDPFRLLLLRPRIAQAMLSNTPITDHQVLKAVLRPLTVE